MKLIPNITKDYVGKFVCIAACDNCYTMKQMNRFALNDVPLQRLWTIYYSAPDYCTETDVAQLKRCKSTAVKSVLPQWLCL